MARLVGLICLLTCVAWPAVAADDPGGLPRLNPLTGQPYSDATRAEYERQLSQMATQGEIAEQVTEQHKAEHAAAIEANKPTAQAFEQKLQAYADSRGVSGGTSKTIHTTYTADGLPESGEVYWRNNAGDVVYRAEFDTKGNLISEGQTADGRAWEAIGAARQAGGTIDYQFEEVPGGGYHISKVDIRDADGNVRAVLEFNEQGEVWRGSYYDENGNLIRKVDRPDLAPEPDTMGGPLPVPGQVRPITGVCDKCQPLANARNDLAGELDAVVRRMQDVSEQHTTAFRNQQYWLKHEYAQLTAQYDALKPQFDAAHARLMACLKTCDQPAPAQPDTSNIVDSGGCTAATIGPCTEPPDACDVSLGPCDAAPAPDPQLGTNPPATPASFDATGIQPTAELYPSDDSDLDAVIATANDYAARGGQCSAMECPKGDCARIQQVAQLLLDLETYLEAMNEWARLAHDGASQAFSNQVANTIQASDQLARTQLANAWHQALHNFASSLFNIASLMDFAKGVATGEKSLDEMNLPELLDSLDGMYGAMKDMEGQISTLGDIEGDPNMPSTISDLVGNGTGQFNNQMINNTIDTISDAKSALIAVAESGKDWRKWIKGGGLGAVGSIAGTWLTTISEAQLNERLQVANDLADNVIPAQQKAQGSAYDEMRRAANRHWSVQDALTAVRAARSAWSACAMKACGAASLTKPTLPEFLDVSPDGKTTIKSYGRALRYYNALVAAINTALQPPPEIRNDCPATPDTAGVVQSGTPTAFVMGDSSTYCRYLPASPVPIPLSPIPPGGAPLGGAPGIPPPPGTPPAGQPDDTTDTNNPPEGTPPPPQTTAPPPDQPKDEPEPPPSLAPNVIVKARASVLSSAPAGEPVAGFEVKLMPADDVALPGDGTERVDAGFADPPAQCTTGADGSCSLAAGADDLKVCSADGNCEAFESCPECRWELAVDATDQTSLNVETGLDFDPASLGELQPYVVDTLKIGTTQYVTLTFPVSQQDHVTNVLGTIAGVLQWDANLCGDKQPGPNDPLYLARGTWGQNYPDQWGLEHIGFTTGADSAWPLIDANAAGVVVAVIDSGLDWNHADIDWDRLWRNPTEIPDNGVDDDRNGYVDDVIGWNFVDHNNKPWDYDGHGTFVTGVIAATADNGIGIAGASPVARIMVLKALNAFGHTRASYLAKALVYAADNGARVVNLSVGHRKLARIETAAIDYAWRKGVVVVAAAGNEGIDVADYGIASLGHVVTVGAVDPTDQHPVFSNWGAQVDLAAPGVDVLSLRARRTDTMLGIPEVKYVPGSAFVGADARYYRASGTSFAAPFVAAVASLVIAQHPTLKPDAVRRVLVQSARDVGVPGVDQYAGYGVVDARAALTADPNFFLDASITRVQVAVVDGKQVLQVFGSVNADALASAHVELGVGDAPKSWQKVGAAIDAPVQDALLVNVPAGLLRGAPQWTLRVVAEHDNGRTREAHFLLNLN